MLRVFLVIDDYNELMYLQTLLKKLGFDTEGVQNPKKYADLSLGFNPQVLLATARGKVVDGLQLARQIKKRQGIPRIILLRLYDQNFSEQELEDCGVDKVLESPINPRQLIQVLAEIGSMDETTLLEKFSKMKGLVQQDDSLLSVKYDENGQPIEDLSRVKQSLRALDENKPTAPKFPLQKEREPHVDAKSPLTNTTRVTPEHDKMRVGRFDKWRQEIGPLPKKNFDRDRIIEFNKKIRAAPAPDDIDEIEDERKKFVAKLFLKGKS